MIDDAVVAHDTTSEPAGTETAVGVLEQLSPEASAALERAVREVRVGADEVVFREGDPGASLFIVRSGLVEIVGGDPTSYVRIDTVGPGESIGEQSLLTGRPRSATAIAHVDTVLWELALADFLELLGRHPELGIRVARLLSDRIHALARPGLTARVVALAAPTQTRAAALAAALVPECERLLGAAPAVVACCPEGDWPTAHADATFVAPDDARAAAARLVRTHPLVLLLFAPTVPPGVAATSDLAVDVDLDQIVGDAAGTSALARRVCARTIGLALGSGGIRGFAHAGVLEVLAANDIPVDYVSGASAGSIAGAFFLSGVPPEELADFAALLRSSLLAGLPRLSLSPQSLLPGRRLRSVLRQRLGNRRFEDLPVPFTIATTDLATRQVHYLESGDLADAVAASCAIPGVFPPVAFGDSRLVDGGATDPVPVTRLRERGADVVVAVNVMRLGTDILGLHLPRVPLPMPAIVTNLLVGLDTLMSEISAQTSNLADVTIEPTVDQHRWNDVLPIATYRAAGERAARAALPELRRLVGARR